MQATLCFDDIHVIYQFFNRSIGFVQVEYTESLKTFPRGRVFRHIILVTNLCPKINHLKFEDNSGLHINSCPVNVTKC